MNYLFSAWLFLIFILQIMSIIVQDFDLDETFGAVEADTKLEGTIELAGRMNGPYATHEFKLRVSFVKCEDNLSCSFVSSLFS